MFGSMVDLIVLFVAKSKTKLQNILNFYVNLNKDVEKALDEFIQVHITLEEQIRRLTNLKAQIEEASAGKGDREPIILAEALDALCEEYNL